MSITVKRRAAWGCIAACIAAAIALAVAGRLGAYHDFAAGFAGAAGITALMAVPWAWLRKAGGHAPGEDLRRPDEPCPYPACHHNQQQRGDEAA